MQSYVIQFGCRSYVCKKKKKKVTAVKNKNKRNQYIMFFFDRYFISENRRFNNMCDFLPFTYCDLIRDEKFVTVRLCLDCDS